MLSIHFGLSEQFDALEGVTDPIWKSPCVSTFGCVCWNQGNICVKLPALLLPIPLVYLNRLL